MSADVLAEKKRLWILVAVAIWLFVASATLLIHRDAVAALDFADTDDAQRFGQVRDWLGGQAWGDIDQHRMNPPAGAVMHWSRLVDLPIAGLYLIAAPVAGPDAAERAAAALAPQFALLMAMLMVALAAFRLAGPKAAVLAPLFLAASGQLLPYFAPLRIDHHGWQVALLLGIVAMLVDGRMRMASGVAAGAMAAVALTIALEFLPHIALASLVLAAAWVARPAFGPMLQGYGAALALGTAAAYPAFVPTARWGAAMCDAMSPVYLAALVASGLLAFALPRFRALDTTRRRGVAAAAGLGVVGASLLYFFPHCAGGPTAGLDPRLLPVLERINEARSLLSYLEDKPETVLFYGLYPLVGIAASAIMLRGAGTEHERFGWLLVLILLGTTSLLMLAQVRAMSGPHAIAVVAAAALASRWLPRARSIAAPLPRILATVALLLGTTAALPLFAGLAVAQANGNAGNTANQTSSCTAAATLAPISRLPRGVMANVVDMGPALLVHTPHTIMAGPYHRSANMILDGMAIWRAGDDEARAIGARYDADYLLGCVAAGDLSMARREAPAGLWARLEAGQVPAWLEPLPLTPGSPLRLYRIKG